MYPYEVATMSRLLKIVGFLCKRALYKRLYSAKEPYDFKEPTNRSHPTWRYIPIHIIRSQKWRCTWTSLSPQARHHWDGIIGRYRMMRRLRKPGSWGTCSFMSSCVYTRVCIFTEVLLNMRRLSRHRSWGTLSNMASCYIYVSICSYSFILTTRHMSKPRRVFLHLFLWLHVCMYGYMYLDIGTSH